MITVSGKRPTIYSVDGQDPLLKVTPSKIPDGWGYITPSKEITTFFGVPIEDSRVEEYRFSPDTLPPDSSNYTPSPTNFYIDYPNIEIIPIWRTYNYEQGSWGADLNKSYAWHRASRLSPEQMMLCKERWYLNYREVGKSFDFNVSTYKKSGLDQLQALRPYVYPTQDTLHDPDRHAGSTIDVLQGIDDRL